MLEKFVVPATAQRLRSYEVGAHLDAFCDWLARRGYSEATVRSKLCSVSCLSRWLDEKRVAVAELDARRIDEFIEERRRRGRTCRGYRLTLLQLVGCLRAAGVLPTLEPVRDDSPTALLMKGYEQHLRRERALVNCTVMAYLPFARELIIERAGGNAERIASLCADDVRAFLIGRVRRMAPKRAQYMATALRSFLRFLFQRGATRTDLSFAVPTVRQWRLSSIPRHLPEPDVERLLQACDLSSVTGRRDHALLLLLARLGLRASEVIALELGDLRWRDGEIIVHGKGRIRDRLPLLPEVGTALACYLKRDRPPAKSRRVFLCRRAPLRGFGHPSTVSTIVARALARARLAPATRGAHLLRHSLATSMLRRGASLPEIGQVLRHRSANTTEIYAKLDFDALRDVAMPWPTDRGVL